MLALEDDPFADVKRGKRPIKPADDLDALGPNYILTVRAEAFTYHAGYFIDQAEFAVWIVYIRRYPNTPFT